MRISDWSSDVCSSDLVALAGPLQLGIIGLLVPVDRRGERRQRRRLQTLRQGLFGNGAPNPAIAVLERMNRLEPQMRKRPPRARWHRSTALRTGRAAVRGRGV